MAVSETTRRDLLRSTGVLLGASALGACAPTGPAQDCPPPERGFVPRQAGSFWKSGGWFEHDTVDASRVGEGIIRAQLEGAWRELSLARLPDRFVSWSFEERIIKLGEIARKGFDTRDLDGPHNACVATFGGVDNNSFTSLNTAYKGMGFMPAPEHLAEAVQDLQVKSEVMARAGLSMPARMARALEVLEELYRQPDLFDRRRQVSLELFATPSFTTHTFANMLANPVCSASFLAFPTFELRCVPQLLHPADPGLSEAERLAIAWTNGVHDLAHGGGDGAQRITCIYHVVEIYDDSPSAGGRGTRLE
jgi:hypothetical protein